MDEARKERHWYQKKRYLIPAGVVLLAIALSGDGDDSNLTTTSESITETSSINLPRYVPTQQNSPSTQEVKRCHPSYSGCLNPNASDYDCAGGSGNGPYYTGTVRVIGPDVFNLDRDNDGWGCE